MHFRFKLWVLLKNKTLFDLYYLLLELKFSISFFITILVIFNYLLTLYFKCRQIIDLESIKIFSIRPFVKFVLNQILPN